MVLWDRRFLRTGQAGRRGKKLTAQETSQTPAFDDVVRWPVRTNGRVFAFRLFYRTGMRCLHQGLPRVMAMGDHDKERKWKELLISRILEAGLQTCFWLLCDE